MKVKIDQKKQISKQLIMQPLAAIALTVLFGAAGMIARSRGNSVSAALDVLGLISLMLLLLLSAVSVVGFRIYDKRLSNTNARRQDEIVSAQRERIQSDFAHEQRRMIHMREGFDLYIALISLLAMTTAFSISPEMAVSAPFAVLAFTGVLRHMRICWQKMDFSRYTDPADYPKLHALAGKAAAATGVKNRVRIVFMPDNNAGIAKVGRQISLQIGVEMLDVMTENELYQILLHEFAHIAPSSEYETAEYRLYTHLLNQLVPEYTVAFDAPFLLLREAYGFKYSMYAQLASARFEAEADRVIIERGDPQAMADGMAKLHFQECFDREGGLLMREPLYAPETMPTDAVSRKLRRFREILSQRETVWRKMLEDEIQARNATHPIARERIRAMGVSEYSTGLPGAKDSLADEREKAIRAMDREMYESINPNYAEIREERYLAPKRLLEQWEQDGRPLEEERIRPVVDAFETLCMMDRAEKLCDRVIAEAENPYAAAYARFSKGSYLLQRMDKAGIALIYEAIDLNSNYIDSGLEMIGDACCRFGWQEELEEYRARAIELIQQSMDSSDGGSLTVRDKLQPEKLPEGMLEGIMNYIRSIDNGLVRRVYLVRKLLNSDGFRSAFVIEFEPKTSDEELSRIMDSIFEHLDVHPSGWWFSLFLYDPETAKAVASVKDSCVYRKE